MNYSKRVSSMQSSPIRKLSPFEEAAKKNGIKVYHLNIGQPDIKTPSDFFYAVKNFNNDVLEYCPSQGIPELVSAIQNYYLNYDIKFDKDEILVTNGGSEALLFAIMAVCDPNDNILTPEPFYTNYLGFTQAANVNIVPITTTAEDGFRLPSKEYITSKINSNTKAILLTNPSNPTGTVYTKDEVKMISEIALKHNLWIISDEVYREFIYDDSIYTSFGNIDEVNDRVIIIDSISKRYSACGARIGSIASKNKNLISQILKLCQSRLCVSTLDQIGAVDLYNTPVSYFNNIKDEYNKRRDVLYNELMKVNGVVCKKPHGAFYILAKLPIEDAEDFAIWMLSKFNRNNETVMICPAEGFYSTKNLGKNEIRLAYILNEKDLKRAAQILKEGLEEYIK
ncbi:pyridoxal phosphate-dependent aminotransferase [Romboutsia sp. 1001713B170207_170306_H8]|uniref:pyridoxal phosphate-dependent aminotransferase n=1 Tax=Romboutsia sp. 1001713B170207_170306_H8 TaxID=2787112 RepID=UPI000821A396|nr:pyridoxal phosphate-dependent aminotransferase [Romboutsia sp. 1001713B170207_170306_H8]SCH04636.1 Aspartate aminotransferase [uncultured Clostridium sp.]